MSGQIKQANLVTRLAQRMALPVPKRVRERAVWHLVDWLGCAIAGAREPAGEVLLEAERTGAVSRVFALGGLGNILEMDDVDKRAILHPGPSIVAATLVIAEQMPGADMLCAIARGYEATIRLGRASGAGHYALWHSTGTCGAIGAAAASASVLELDQQQTAQAMALAVCQSAGLWQTRHDARSMGKQLHTAHAARAGVEAARLAGLGMMGPLSIIEGPQGFFAAMCPDADPEDVMKNYDRAWLIDDVSFKPWPACRHTHAAIDAALMARETVTLAEIGAITVRTYADALKFCDRPNPSEIIEAKFSLQHAVAVGLLHGAPEMRNFDKAAIADPDVSALRARIHVEVSETYEAVYPARFGAEVEIENGVNTELFKVSDALGDPENPLATAAIEAKAVGLMDYAGVAQSDVESLIANSKALVTGGAADVLHKILKRVL